MKSLAPSHSHLFSRLNPPSLLGSRISSGSHTPEDKRGRSSRSRPSVSVVARIQVDRRRHLEELFRRQLVRSSEAPATNEDEKRRAEMLVSCPVDCVREVRKLDELEDELAKASERSELVVVDFYNSACGACKYMLPPLVSLCKAEGCSADSECDVASYVASSVAKPQELDGPPSLRPARGVRFLKHNIRDDYDDLTDIARLYRVKFVPTFALFSDGARVDQVATRSPAKLLAMLSLWLGAGGGEE